MRIEEILEKADSIRRNPFSKQDKTDWIEELEERLWSSLWHKYFEFNPRKLQYPADKDKHIFIEKPYYKLYLLYILGQMDFFQGNIPGYNAHVRAFNRELASYMQYLAKNYRAIV